MPDLLEVFVRFGEEIVHLMVEVVAVFAQGAMARVRDNPGQKALTKKALTKALTDGMFTVPFSTTLHRQAEIIQ
jgi:hypothetical protein